jgi:sorting nexin-14
MPAKFARERGQNLKPYLTSLTSNVLQSSSDTTIINNHQHRSSSADIRSLGGDTISSISSSLSGCIDHRTASVKSILFQSIYGNNCSLAELTDNVDCRLTSHSTKTSIYDTLMYVCWKVLHISPLLLSIIVSTRTMLRDAIDIVIHGLLGRLLRFALHDANIVRLIQILQSTLYDDESINDNVDDEQQRVLAKQRTIEFLIDKLPESTLLAIGQDQLINAVQMMHECVQHPRLNKQLSYVLLDILVYEMFPTIRQS